MKGLTIRTVATVTEKDAMFPYLFRKLLNHAFRQDTLAYWAALEAGTDFVPDLAQLSLTGFFDGGNPYIFLVKEKDFVKLEEVLQVTQTRLMLKTAPQNIVFLD
ncbi:MAG: hypothetical protein R3D55_19005 [Chloroflexota bacterium]